MTNSSLKSVYFDLSIYPLERIHIAHMSVMKISEEDLQFQHSSSESLSYFFPVILVAYDVLMHFRH
jgi:hypothetical protein